LKNPKSSLRRIIRSSGDAEISHGVMMVVLDFVRRVGARICLRSRREQKGWPPMKTFPPNVVLALALALGALGVVQWVRASRLRAQVDSLRETILTQKHSIANNRALARRYEAEIIRLDLHVKELKASEQTNLDSLCILQSNWRRAESLRNQIAGDKEAADQQSENLRKQNNFLTLQNETLKQLVFERKDLVEKLSAQPEESNVVAAQHNGLIQQVEQVQKKGGNK
jgi:hypothetical protein